MQPVIIKPFTGKPLISKSLICKLMPSVLANVPFHTDTAAITRYFAEAFPLHMAIHHVSPVFTPPVEYTKPHIHEDSDEINIIISPDKLVYKIQLDDKEYIVQNNASIWIPRGMVHSANVLRGSGFFVALRLN